MTQKLAQQGFMVKVTVQMASGPGKQYYIVGKDTEPEALDAVFQFLGAPSQTNVVIGHRLSAQEIAQLGLEPGDIKLFIP